MIKDIFLQAMEAMRFNGRRTAITVVGMAWGIATVVLLLAYGAGFGRAFEAIQKRVAARYAVAKLCERDANKYCGSVKGDRAQTLDCLLAGPRGMTINCNKALGEAGYR